MSNILFYKIHSDNYFKSLKRMRKWIEDRLIIIIVLILITYGLFTVELTPTWGINKTVNWIWDITNLLFLIPIIFWVALMLIYSLLAIFKISTNLILSSIQLILLLVLLFVVQNHLHDLYLHFSLSMVGLLVLIINTITSIRKKWVL